MDLFNFTFLVSSIFGRTWKYFLTRELPYDNIIYMTYLGPYSIDHKSDQNSLHFLNQNPLFGHAYFSI